MKNEVEKMYTVYRNSVMCLVRIFMERNGVRYKNGKADFFPSIGEVYIHGMELQANISDIYFNVVMDRPPHELEEWKAYNDSLALHKQGSITYPSYANGHRVEHKGIVRRLLNKIFTH